MPSMLPPKKRDWTPGSYQVGYFIRTPHGTILEGTIDKAEEKVAVGILKLAIPEAAESLDQAVEKANEQKASG